MSIKIKSSLDNLLNKINGKEKKMVKGMKKAHIKIGSLCENALKKSLAKSGGAYGSAGIRYSAENELPLKHSGRLQGSMGFITRSKGKKVETLIGSIRNAIKYALYLETKKISKGGRPYLNKICDPIIKNFNFRKYIK